jgi:small-conductance mechanosensitive channel
VLVLAQAAEELDEALPHGLTAADWIQAGVILLAGIVLAQLIRAVTARMVGSEEGELGVAHVVGRLVGYVVLAAALIWALDSLDVRLAPLLGALGIGGLAVAFAAQSILENFFSSIVLRSRRPFRRGDQITTGEHEGTVQEVNFRTVALRTYDGERVLVPCADVLSNPIVNHTAYGRRRTAITVGVAYGTDLRKAQHVLLEATAGVDGVLTAPRAPEAWVEQFGESSIDFVLRFWHAPDIATEWRVRSNVAMAVNDALADAGIDIPFPQRVVWFSDARAEE